MIAQSSVESFRKGLMVLAPTLRRNLVIMEMVGNMQKDFRRKTLAEFGAPIIAMLPVSWSYRGAPLGPPRLGGKVASGGLPAV